MSLSSPLALLGLLLVPLVILLHSLAVRWKKREISSLAFWNEVLRENRTSMRIRRILRNLVLLAEVLAVAAIVLALAGPVLSRRGGAAGDAILVLDTTASMKTREGSRTRFDEARDRALEEMAGMRRGGRMLIIASGRMPRIIAPFTEDRERLRGAIQAAAAGDEPGDLREGILLALSLRSAARQDRVLVITDGAFDSLGDLGADVPWMRWIRVGSPRSNAGITALAFRRTAASGEGYEMFLSVRSYSPRILSFPLIVSAGQARVLREEVTLAPGQSRAISIPWTGPTTGRVTAGIGVVDDLDADNRAFAVFAPARAARVRLVGERNVFLESAFLSLPNVTVTRAAAGDLGAAAGSGGAGEADITVYDGTPVPPLGRGSFVVIGSVPQGLPVTSSGTREGLRVAGTSSRHPLMASVSIDGMAIGRALRLEPGAGFTPLAMAGGAPVLVAWDQAGVKLLLFGFDIRDSDLPLRTAFPVLLANSLDWFLPSWLSVHAEQVEPGRTVALPSTAGRPLSVLLPGGGRRTLDGTGEPVEFTETSACGFYRVEGGGEAREFAVSLASPTESDISPRFPFPADAGDAAKSAPGRAGVNAARAAEPATASPQQPGARGEQVPLWGALALAGFALIILEWMAWLRESARGRGGRRA